MGGEEKKVRWSLIDKGYCMNRQKGDERLEKENSCERMQARVKWALFSVLRALALPRSHKGTARSTDWRTDRSHAGLFYAHCSLWLFKFCVAGSCTLFPTPWEESDATGWHVTCLTWLIIIIGASQPHRLLPVFCLCTILLKMVSSILVLPPQQSL